MPKQQGHKQNRLKSFFTLIWIMYAAPMFAAILNGLQTVRLGGGGVYKYRTTQPENTLTSDSSERDL